MDIKDGLFDKNELKISVENVSLELLVSTGKNPSSPIGFKQIWHSHFYTELFVCFEGKIDIQTESEIISIEKDCAAIIPPKLSHYKITAEDNSNWNAIGFTITKKHNSSSFDLYSKLVPICLNIKPTVYSNVSELCKNVEAIHKLSSKYNNILPAIEMVCALLKLAEKKPNTKLLDTTNQVRLPDIYRIAWFEEIIQNRFYEPLTITKLAESLHISSRQLSRIIKAQYGTTFHNILKKKRLANASKLLTTSLLTANEILRKVGYNKSSAFYKDFFEEFNMTPTEYRKKFSA